MFASIFADESQFLQNNFSTASHLGYNNKFKEAVLAEAMRDEREQLSIKMKFVRALRAYLKFDVNIG